MKADKQNELPSGIKSWFHLYCMIRESFISESGDFTTCDWKVFCNMNGIVYEYDLNFLNKKVLEEVYDELPSFKQMKILLTPIGNVTIYNPAADQVCTWKGRLLNLLAKKI